jgi:hypothetical protein
VKAYTVRKGKHAFTPYAGCLKRNPLQMAWRVKFGTGTDYSLPYPDNRDWNKGGGLSYRMLTNHEHSIMWGWRWNADKQAHEVCMYTHLDGERKIGTSHTAPPDLTDKEVALIVPRGVECLITLKKQDGKYRMGFSLDNGPANYCTLTYTHREGFARCIGAWFGGNRAASNDMTLHIDRT